MGFVLLQEHKRGHGCAQVSSAISHYPDMHIHRLFDTVIGSCAIMNLQGAMHQTPLAQPHPNRGSKKKIS